MNQEGCDMLIYSCRTCHSFCHIHLYLEIKVFALNVKNVIKNGAFYSFLTGKNEFGVITHEPNNLKTFYKQFESLVQNVFNKNSLLECH